MLGRATSNLELIRLTTTRTWGKHFAPLHEGHIHMVLSRDSQMGVSKFPQLGLSQLWGCITSRVDLWLRWGLNQSCSPCREIFNSMLHVAYTWGNWVDSRLLVVGSQTANLIFDIFWGHNLCFRCLNARCKPFSDMYVSIAFQWYKELFKIMGFDPYNHILKIQDSNS